MQVKMNYSKRTGDTPLTATKDLASKVGNNNENIKIGPKAGK